MRWCLRATVVVSLAAAGVLWVAAAAQRWWPVCRRGDFDADACLARQDHLYDYVAPTGPWVPVGHAAELAGVALVLLALGVALLPWLWAPRRPLVSLAVAVPALSVLMVGVLTWDAGVSGDPAPVSGVPAFFLWSVGLPVALVVAASAGRDSRAARRTTRHTTRPTSRSTTSSRGVIVVLLTLSTPLWEVGFSPVLVGYLSHDSTPWAEVVTGVLLVAAAVASWPATASPPRLHHGPSRATVGRWAGEREGLVTPLRRAGTTPTLE